MFFCVGIIATILIPYNFTKGNENTFVNLFYLAFGALIIISVKAGTAKKKEMKRQSTANFHYTIEKYGPMHYIAIVDFGGPYTAMIDDIENIINDIRKWEGIQDMKDYFIIFKDAEGMWDGWDPQTNQPVLLRDDNSLEAAKHFFTIRASEVEINNEIYERMSAE